MSWLSGITDSLGSIFGYDTLGSDISDWLGIPGSDVGAIGESIVGVANPASSSAGSSIWSSPSFINSIIGAGGSLAAQYYQGNQNKDVAELYAQQQLAANQADIQSRKDVAQIYAGAQTAAANAAAEASRKKTLADLYNNYANMMAQAGATKGNIALGTGRGITEGINARAAALR